MNLARIVSGCRSPERCISQVAIDAIQVHTIEKIKCIGPELEFPALGVDVECLAKRKISVKESGADIDVATQVSQGAQGRRAKRAGWEGALNKLGVARTADAKTESRGVWPVIIRPVGVPVAALAGVRAVKTLSTEDIEGSARLGRDDRAELPASRHLAQQRILHAKGTRRTVTITNVCSA